MIETPGRKLIIQIPCFNEEATLAVTLAELPRSVRGFDTVELLVIDDGSSDHTSRVAAEHGVHHVVRIPENRGLANAFRVGLEAALRHGADVIVNTDADNQYQGRFVPDLTAPILAGDADLVIGERSIERVDDFSSLKKRLQRAGSSMVRWLSATNVTDAASGFRAFSREAALRLQVHGRYSYTVETVIQAGWENLRICNVPIEVNPATRPSRLVRSIPHYLVQSAHSMIRSFALYKPFRFFFLVGTLPFTAGLLLMIRWLYVDLMTDSRGHVPSLVGATACLLLACQIWLLGFLADLLSVNRRILSDVQVRLRRAELAEPSPPASINHLDGVVCAEASSDMRISSPPGLDAFPVLARRARP